MNVVRLVGCDGLFGMRRLGGAAVLRLREREFVVAARSLGARSARVILRHVLPNAAAPIIVSAALGIGSVMLLEAGVSFVGMRVASPQPRWGKMVAGAQDPVPAAPRTPLFPRLAPPPGGMSPYTRG